MGKKSLKTIKQDNFSEKSHGFEAEKKIDPAWQFWI